MQVILSQKHLMKIILLAALSCICAFPQASTPIYGSRTIVGGVNVFTTTGTANALVGAMPSGSTITAYTPGVTYSTVLSSTNTGVATLNIDSVGAKAIKQTDASTDIAASTLVSGAAASFLYNGSTFQYLGGGGSSSSSPSAPPGGTVSTGAPMYLYAHFRDDDQSLYLSYSYDGFSWKTINPFGSYGLGYLRDPTVYYTGGAYYFLFTGLPGQVQSFSSTNLINFTSVVTQTLQNEPAGTQQNWAPEFFKDPVSGNTYVAFALQNSGGTFQMYLYPWTTAGVGATPTAITVNGTRASKIFDPYIYYKGGTYYLFFADADNVWPAEPHAQTISYATSSTLTGTYTVPSSIQSNRSLLGIGNTAEAPTVFDLPNGCQRIIADTYTYLPFSFYNANNYKPRYVDSCDNFVTFGTSVDVNISRAEHGTVLPLTLNSQAFTVLEAEIKLPSNTAPSHFGVNQLWPKYTLEVKSNAAMAALQYDEPASLAANPGNDVDAIWSACGGSYGQYCPTPPASNGMWLMNSAANAFGQIHINNPTNAVSGMIFSDQATQFGPSRNGPHNWHVGENYTASNHHFHIFDDTGNSSTRKSPFWLTSDTGQVLATYGLALGDGAWMDFTKRASFDSPSAGVVNCGNGTVGDTSCTLNVGALNAGIINGSTSGGAVGYPNVAPNNNTATTSNIVVIGDSHMSGLGQTASIPAQLAPTGTYTVTNFALSGSKFCAYFADQSTHEAAVDAVFNPRARSNILLMEGGLNDAIDNNTGTPAVPWITTQQVYDCEVAYAKRRKALGWKIVIYGAYSRGQTGIGGATGDQLHDQLNNLYTQGWQSWANAYVNISADPNVGADGASTNATYFQGDSIHVVSSYSATLAFATSVMIDHAEFGYLPQNTFVETIFPGENAFFKLMNNHPSFNQAAGMELQTNTRHYYEGLSGPSNGLPNLRYLFDATLSYFPYQLHDRDWTFGALLTLTPYASDPGCSADGKVWMDSSDSNNIHMQVCMRRSGTLGWRTIN